MPDQSMTLTGLGLGGGVVPGGGGGGLGLGGPSSIPPVTCEVKTQFLACGSQPARTLDLAKKRLAVT